MLFIPQLCDLNQVRQVVFHEFFKIRVQKLCHFFEFILVRSQMWKFPSRHKILHEHFHSVFGLFRFLFKPSFVFLFALFLLFLFYCFFDYVVFWALRLLDLFLRFWSLLLFLWLLSSIILFYFLLRLLSLNFLCWFLSGDFGQRFFFLQFRWRYLIDNGLTYSLVELWQRLIFYLLVSIYELLSCFLLFIFSDLLNLFDPICY